MHVPWITPSQKINMACKWDPFKAYKADDLPEPIANLSAHLQVALRRDDAKTAATLLYRLYPWWTSNERVKRLVLEFGTECLKSVKRERYPSPLRRFLDSLFAAKRNPWDDDSMLAISLWYQWAKDGNRAGHLLRKRIRAKKRDFRDCADFLAHHGLLVYHRLLKNSQRMSPVDCDVLLKRSIVYFDALLNGPAGPKEVFLYPYVEVLLTTNQLKLSRSLIRKYGDSENPNSENHYSSICELRTKCKRLKIKPKNYVLKKNANNDPENLSVVQYVRPKGLGELPERDAAFVDVWNLMALLDYAPFARDPIVWTNLSASLNKRSPDSLSDLLQHQRWALERALWWNECYFDLSEVETAFGVRGSASMQRLAIAKSLCARHLYGFEHDYAAYTALAVVFCPTYERPSPQLDDMTVQLLTTDDCFYAKHVAAVYGCWMDAKTFRSATQLPPDDGHRVVEEFMDVELASVLSDPHSDVDEITEIERMNFEEGDRNDGSSGFFFALSDDTVKMWTDSGMADVGADADEDADEKTPMSDLIIDPKRRLIDNEEEEEENDEETVHLPYWSRQIVVSKNVERYGLSVPKRETQSYCDFCATYRARPPFSIVARNETFQTCGLCMHRVGKDGDGGASIVEATRFVCHRCGARLKSIKKLRTHYDLHVRGPAHACRECGRAFPQRRQLKWHLELEHGLDADGNEIPLGAYACDLCDRVFEVPRALEQHRYQQHVRLKGGECAVCGSRVKNLALHAQRVHRRVEPPAWGKMKPIGPVALGSFQNLADVVTAKVD